MKNFKNSNSKSYILTLLKKSLYNTHPVPSYQILISILVSEKKIPLLVPYQFFILPML